MGCFPYDCEKCGGAYERCGQGGSHEGEKCEGDQFCWEPEAILTLDPEQFDRLIRQKKQDYGQHEIKACPGEKQSNGKHTLKATYSGYGFFTHADYPTLKFIIPEHVDIEESMGSIRGDPKAPIVVEGVKCYSCSTLSTPL